MTTTDRGNEARRLMAAALDAETVAESAFAAWRKTRDAVGVGSAWSKAVAAAEAWRKAADAAEEAEGRLP